MLIATLSFGALQACLERHDAGQALHVGTVISPSVLPQPPQGNVVCRDSMEINKPSRRPSSLLPMKPYPSSTS